MNPSPNWDPNTHTRRSSSSLDYARARSGSPGPNNFTRRSTQAPPPLPPSLSNARPRTPSGMGTQAISSSQPYDSYNNNYATWGPSTTNQMHSSRSLYQDHCQYSLDNVFSAHKEMTFVLC